MTDDAKSPYKVGYGRPPKATRFKPGQCPNPKGRPKGSRNFTTEIEAELNSHVQITEHGKRKNVPKRKVIAKQLVNKGTGGDPKAINMLLQHDRAVRSLPAVETAPAEIVSVEDRRVMESAISRILAMRSAALADGEAASMPEDSDIETKNEGGQ